MEQALAYLRQGWSVIPVVLRLEKSGKVSKRPAIKWQLYQQRLPTEEEIRLWFGEGKYTGIGVVTGEISGVVVVDIEHDATDDDVAELESPLESHTISGGRHVFYQWTKPLKNSVRLNDKPIDFRGDGGFVVLPPSQIGHRGYSWLKQADPSSLPALPAQIEHVLTEQSHTDTNRRVTPDIRDKQHTADSFDFPIAYQGERNSTAASVAGSLCANMSPKLWDTVGWLALMQWNKVQCKPPLVLSELRSVWHSITSTHQRKGQESRYTSDGVPKQSTHLILPWSQFRQQQFAEPEWIVESLIPDKGLVAVAGPPESCKSYFTTYVAIAVARGESLFEHYTTKRVGVLLVDQENLPAWIQHRLLQFSAEDQLPLHIYANRDAPFNLEDQTAFAQVVAYIKTHQIGLLILDTLRLSHTRDENSSTDMKPVFDQLKKLTKHATVIFIQHHRKGDRKQYLMWYMGRHDGQYADSWLGGLPTLHCQALRRI
ncbi:MAG: AAA family ATPase [Caldilineaceae bacterium]